MGQLDGNEERIREKGLIVQVIGVNAHNPRTLEAEAVGLPKVQGHLDRSLCLFSAGHELRGITNCHGRKGLD